MYAISLIPSIHRLFIYIREPNKNSLEGGLTILHKLIKWKNKSLPEPLVNIKKELKLQQKCNLNEQPLTLEDKRILQQINDQTKLFNLNNVTRTKAYLDFYNRYPEVHWALLGHMVSRNGGWNMTDLKGSLLSRLLTKKEVESFFAFLERGNWLIFQDAYPQFLVYDVSMKKKQNLSYLLHHLHVSVFMETLWNHFWYERDSYLLTVGLIINEQSYLESRVIKNPIYQKEVFNTLEFKLQDLLSMNHILLPFNESGKVKFVGQTLHHFQNLHERILLGKRLYNILFRNSQQLQLTKLWANANPHTGSRKDYWPHLFNDVDDEFPTRLLKTRLKSCQLLPGYSRFYSPQLEFIWKNRKHPSAEIEDWYEDWNVLYYLQDSTDQIDGEIEHEYCKTLEKMELAAITKKAITILD